MMVSSKVPGEVGHPAEMNCYDTIRLDLPATYKYLNILGACVTEMLSRVEGLSEPEVLAYNLQLAIHETCTNIIDHAYGETQPENRIEITLKLEPVPRHLVMELQDTAGGSFDLSEVAEPDLENGQVHGYGLFLVRSLVDEVVYESQPGKNLWRLVKHL
jgi:serine/threonine-protein kinase RsbW